MNHSDESFWEMVVVAAVVSGKSNRSDGALDVSEITKLADDLNKERRKRFWQEKP